MTEDQINKVETLIGYLEYFVKQRPVQGDEIPAVIEEANEWIEEERKKMED